jgi:hypothetical protein
MSEQHILSAFEVYGDGWALVDAAMMREDVRCGLFCRDPEHREARSDRFVLLVAWAMLVSTMTGKHFSGLRQGDLCLGQLAELVDSGQKVHGNGRESESYLRAALGGLAGKVKGISFSPETGDVTEGQLWRARRATPRLAPVGLGGATAHSFAAPGIGRRTRSVPGARGRNGDEL